MADSSLEVFFAKKDKSKKCKTKTKFTTTDAIARSLEGNVKRTDFVKKDFKEKPLPVTNHTSYAQVSNEQVDDEWKFVEDEDERDYSGLRVQALTICEKDKDDENFKEQMCDENGEFYKSLDALSGPWKVQAATPPEIEDNAKLSDLEIKEDLNTKSGAYKPPALRNSCSYSPSNVNTKRIMKSAPQLSSELHFPSLSSTTQENHSDADRSFQSVKHGIKSKNDAQHKLQLDLENKFSALHQGDQL